MVRWIVCTTALIAFMEGLNYVTATMFDYGFWTGMGFCAMGLIALIGVAVRIDRADLRRQAEQHQGLYYYPLPEPPPRLTNDD